MKRRIKQYQGVPLSIGLGLELILWLAVVVAMVGGVLWFTSQT